MTRQGDEIITWSTHREFAKCKNQVSAHYFVYDVRQDGQCLLRLFH